MVQALHSGPSRVRPSPSRRKPVDAKKKFEALANAWETDTRHTASSKQIALHPLAQEIIGMGKPVIPLILIRMKKRPWFWFHALMELTQAKENPVTPAMRGDMQQMTDAWIKWGEDRGII